MKVLDCPYIGKRPQSEFVYAGEVRLQPDPGAVDDHAWADYVFNHSSEPRIQHEWWYHSPSGIWFVWQRNTLTDEFIKVLDAVEVEVLIGGGK